MSLKPLTGVRLRPLAVVLLGWLAAGALVGALVIDGRRTAVERTQRSTAAFAVLVEEHTASTLSSIRLTLRAVADSYYLAPRPRKNDAEFRALMASRLRDVPYVRSIFIIGPDGRLIHDTDYPRTPDVPLADREYFRAHAEDPEMKSAISPPIQSRSGTGWFLAVTERLGRGEAFEGVLVAAVQTSHFEELFRRMDLAKSDGIALLYRSGELIAHRGPARDDATGKSFAHLQLFVEHLPQHASGTYSTGAGLFPDRSIMSYRTVADAPFVVVVARSGYLAEWRRTAIGAAVAMGALTVMLGFLLYYLLRDSRRRELARRRRAQAEKLEALGQLTGGMAHDFANLLHVISLNLHLIAVRPLDERRMEEAIAAAQRAVARGTTLVSHLLAFAKRQPMRLKSVELGPFVADARGLLAQAAGPRIELRTECAADLPPVMIDETQLEVALLNLVVNARDAMSGAGHIALRTYACTEEDAASVGSGTPADYVCLAVADDGPGMTESVLRRAVEPFFSTKGEAGTGLGLSQVYGFMQQISGTMRIESTPGKGTTVQLYFPKRPPENPPPAAAPGPAGSTLQKLRP
jgi:two-component system, NtrC family, sensor kinase